MQIESRKNNRNKNAKRLNLLKGRQPRNPSQTNGGAKIRINSEIAIPKLKKLAQDYIGVADPQGFLTDLRIALGIPNSQGASKYGEVTIPKEDGSELKASLRITNHQANAEQYIKHNANYEYNLSIVVRRKERRNTFTPHEDVRLDEYVYYGKNIAQVENPLSQIVNGIVEFLQNGKYEDTTGIALKNTSPITTENKELNCNLNMNKKLIRLTESDIHRIVKESVNRVVEDTRAQRKKDPMNQWFRDMDNAQKYRDNMEYITKGGRKPKHWKQPTNEGVENETRFLPHLKRTYENLYREYEHWQYATYKPQGMDDAISAIIAAMHSVEDIIKSLEPSDNIPTWEDPQQY